MARRHASLTERVDRLAHTVAASTPSREDAPFMLAVIEARHDDPDDRARVTGWLYAMVDPEHPDAARVCCPQHAARRVHLWFTRPALTLDEIEQTARTCPPGPVTP